MHRSTPWTATTAIVAFVVGTIGVLGAAPASAATTAAPGGVLQILSPLSSSRGTPEFADGADVQLLTADTTRGIDARMTTGPGSGASFTLEPPEGEPLTTGVFQLVGDQPYVQRVPTLTIDSTVVTGEFDVLDLASDPSDGRITRFDAIVPGIGEFRFGEAGDATVDGRAPVVVGATSLVFAEAFVGHPAAAQQETLHNTGTAPVALGTPRVSGPQATSFSVAASTCGTTLAAGATCHFSVRFAPRAGGPATAAVAMPIAGVSRTVPLTGTAFLGQTGMTSSGEDAIDEGRTTTVTAADTDMTVRYSAAEWIFEADSLRDGSNVLMIELQGPDGGPLARGTRKTSVGGQGNGYEVRVSVRSMSCDTTGTERVKHFRIDPVTGLPDLVDVAFTQSCFGDAAQTGRLQWQARTDTTVPAAPSGVTVSGTGTGTGTRSVSWKPSTSTDAVSTVARLVQGDGIGATPQSGIPLPVQGATAAVPPVPDGQRSTVAVFAVDRTGNTSRAATAGFGTTPVTVTGPGRPTITSVTTGPGSITVAFTPPTDDGGLPITGYELATTTGDHHVSGTAGPLTLTGLPADTYAVWVVADNAAGRGTWSYQYEPVRVGP